MRLRSPASRGSFQLRFAVFDVVWAAASPVLAILFRDTALFSPDHISVTAIYCFISFGFALLAFLIFRVRDGMADYFSVHDALEVAKAVAVAELLTITVLFTVTRLDGIPRSTPIIHALILAAGLVLARVFVRMTKNGHKEFFASAPTETEHIIMIGTTKLTSLYMQLIETYSPDTRQVIAILDDNPQLIGRSIAGIRVVGPPSHLESIINEFSDHGIHTDRVVVGGDPNMLSVEQIDQIDHICDNHEIHLDFVPSLVGLTDSQTEPAEAPENPPQPPPTGTISQYLRTKRFFDFTLGVALSFLLLPVFFVVAALVLLDVGSPIFFWQRRVGVGGHSFLLHKFRTLKTSFDWRGLPVPNPERLSQIGSLLRRFRLDELPQLLNVIVGDMAIVGPRPLLPRDQPPDPSLRLLARPGITGWAQVNGGKLLSSAEKAELDEWYIRHASFWLDLRILAKTVHVLIWGERRHDAERVHKTAIKQELNVSSPSKSSST